MKQVLIDNGWYKFSSCRCGGSYKEKYKHPSKPGVQIHIRPNKNTWEHKISSSTYARGNGETSLQTKLNEI